MFIKIDLTFTIKDVTSNNYSFKLMINRNIIIFEDLYKKLKKKYA